MNPGSWIEESFGFAKNFAYSRELHAAIRAAEENGEDEVVFIASSGYRFYAGKIAKQQAVQAGFRIAKTLKAK